jgi:hypothetical protein
MPVLAATHSPTRSPLRSPTEWRFGFSVANQTVEFGALTLAGAGAAIPSYTGSPTSPTWSIQSGNTGSIYQINSSTGALSTVGAGTAANRTLVCRCVSGGVNFDFTWTVTAVANAYSVATTAQMQAVIDLSSTPSALAGKAMRVRAGTYDTITDLTFSGKFVDQTGTFTIAPHGTNNTVTFSGWSFSHGSGVQGTNWVGDVSFIGINFYRDISWWDTNNIGFDTNAWLVGLSADGGMWSRNVSFDYCIFSTNMAAARFGNYYANYPSAIGVALCDTCNITNCTAYGVGQFTTVIGPDWTINNNTLYNHRNDFVRVNASSSVSFPTENFTITNNTVYDNVDNMWIYHFDFIQMFGSTNNNIGPGVIRGNIMFPGYEGVRIAVGGTSTLFDFNANLKTGDYTILAGDDGDAFAVRAMTGAITFTLPATAAVSTGWKVSVSRQQAGSNAIQIAKVGGDTINGGAGPISLPDMWDSVLIEKTGAGAWTATLDEVINGPCVKYGNFSIASTVDNRVYFVDATAGPVTVTLPSAVASSGNEFVVQKIDATSNAVTVDLNGSDTYTARVTGSPSENPVLSTRWRALYLVSIGTSVWTESYMRPHNTPIIMQSLGTGSYTGIEISGNIFWAGGTITNEESEASITDTRVFNNTLIQPIPGDVDGDGYANKYPDGFEVSLNPGIYGFGDATCALYKNLSNIVAASTGSPLIYDNNTDLDNSDLSTFTTLLAGGNTATDFFPLTRENAIEMARPRSVGNAFYGAIGTTNSNGYYNFATGAVNTVPAPTIISYTPLDNATSVAGNSDLVALFDQPVKKGTGNVLLRKNDGGWSTVETFDIAAGTGSAGGTITVVGRTLTVNPGSDMAAGNEHAIQIASTCIDSRVYGTDFAGIANDTTWSFTASAPSANNLLTNSGVLNAAPWRFNSGTGTITDDPATVTATSETYWDLDNTTGTSEFIYDTNDGADVEFSPAGSTTYTFTMYLKKGSTTFSLDFALRTLGGTDATSTLSINTDTGVISGSPNAAHGSEPFTVQNLGGNEHRVRMTITTPASTNRILAYVNITGANDVLIGSAMVTAGSTVETYVP